MEKKIRSIDTKFPAQSLPSIFIIHPLTYKGTPCIDAANFSKILTHQRFLTWMPLTLCTLSLVCSMCSFLYATFDNHLLRQPPIVSNQPFYIHIYINVCVIQKPKKKKKHTTLYEYSNSNLLHRIVQRSINSKKKNKKQKNDWGKKLLYISASLYLFSSAALTLLSHCWLLLSFYSRPRSPSVTKTTMVTMAAMVTRLVRSKYDPTYNRVRWVVFLLKVRIDLDRGGSTCSWGQDLVIRSSKSLSLPPFIYFICLPRIVLLFANIEKSIQEISQSVVNLYKPFTKVWKIDVKRSSCGLRSIRRSSTKR